MTKVVDAYPNVRAIMLQKCKYLYAYLSTHMLKWFKRILKDQGSRSSQEQIMHKRNVSYICLWVKYVTLYMHRNDDSTPPESFKGI